MNPIPDYIKKAAEEINLASNDLIAASMGRLPQALPKQRIEQILLKHLPKQSEWIAVSERLPEPHQTVLVWNTLQKTEAIIRDYTWHENFSAGITHWVPVPQPPITKARE